MTKEVKIIREKSLVQPYPRSGNFGSQKPSYGWEVWVDGRCETTCRLLRKAKQIAAEYGVKPKIVR